MRAIFRGVTGPQPILTMIWRCFSMLLTVWSITGCDRAPLLPATVATPVSLHFEISGMTCDGCAAMIESKVAQLPGVTGCDASFETGRLTVQAIDMTVEDAILRSVVDLDFEIKAAQPADGIPNKDVTSALWPT